MVDVVSIVLAVVSLVGSLIAAGFTGWISFYLDQVKRQAEAKALTNKYRDPLTLSAYDLQSRLFGIVETKLLDYLHDAKKEELVKLYTAFLVGQYFSWVYIFRRQAQFLRFSTEKTNKRLNRIMDSITIEFSLDQEGENALMLWRGQQMAIGELMTLNEEGQLHCMGFAAFKAKYDDEPTFKKWFEAIEEGILVLEKARKEKNTKAPSKVRRLQHLLIDLVTLLDVDIIASSGYPQAKVWAAHGCRCTDCPGMQKLAVSSTKKEEVA